MDTKSGDGSKEVAMIASGEQLKVGIRGVERQEWETACRGFADYSYRQSWAYATHLARRNGAQAEFVAVEAEGKIIGLTNVRVKHLPVIGGGIAYISGGPMVRRSDGEAMDAASTAESVMKAIAGEFVAKRGLVLRAAPVLGAPEWNQSQIERFNGEGFVPAVHVAKYRTLVVDLSPPESQIRAKLQQKWRNCLNNSERQGIEVRSGTAPEMMEEFRELFDKFRDRKGFHTELGPDFYAAVQAEACEADRLLVQIASKDGQVVAGHVSSSLGDTCIYLLGATSGEGLKCKAAYLLQWRTILHAKERGMRWYDLGGIDGVANPGVLHFKEGMSGEDRTAPGPFERCPKGVRGMLTLTSEQIYRRITRARERKTQR